VRDFKLVDTATGEPLTIEFLLGNPGYERFVLFYKETLNRLGIEVTVRLVDVQYENRLRHWDFDIVVDSWTETLSPGNELRDYWGSQAAVMPGSRNIIGIANKAVDALIQQVVFAKNRDELMAAARALDRVLLWNHYVVPQWIYGLDTSVVFTGECVDLIRNVKPAAAIVASIVHEAETALRSNLPLRGKRISAPFVPALHPKRR